MKIITSLILTLLLAQQYVPVTKYDPKRDGDKDIKDAIVEAQRTGKRILLEVGGEWCSWCHILDRYYLANPKLTQLQDTNYVTVKINFSEENLNEELLSRYPKIPGYPHFIVLETDGTFLHSQGTSELEEGESYHLERFTAFLTKWVPIRK